MQSFLTNICMHVVAVVLKGKHTESYNMLQMEDSIVSNEGKDESRYIPSSGGLYSTMRYSGLL